MKAAGALNGNWKRGWVDRELDGTGVLLTETDRLELEARIKAQRAMAESPYPGTAEPAKERLAESLKLYAELFGVG